MYYEVIITPYRYPNFRGLHSNKRSSATTLAAASDQSAVDGDALLGSLPRGTGSLQSLRAGQVHEMELPTQ